MRLDHAKTLYFAPEGILINAKLSGRCDLFPFMPFKGLLYGPLFYLPEG